MQLKIKNVGPKDFMDYICMAKNSLGGSDGKITLYGNPFEDKNTKDISVPITHTQKSQTIVSQLGFLMVDKITSFRGQSALYNINHDHNYDIRGNSVSD